MKPACRSRRFAVAAAFLVALPIQAADHDHDDVPHAAHAGDGPRIDRTRLPPRAKGSADERVRPTRAEPKAGDMGAFRTVCAYSHMAFDDPIVFPRQPGRSHLHVFFGNTGADAFSTAASLAASGDSTCRGGIANRSAYWVPATIDTRTGAPVRPAVANIYYKNGYNGIRAEQVQPHPKGLRMIAGDPTNTSPRGPWRFLCVGAGADMKEHAHIPDCPAGSQLIQRVLFPQCWDGRRLDAADHKSHMSYPVQRRCPASHPVALPEITFNIHYDVREPGATRHWRLASDTYAGELPAGRSMHADWFDGWDPSIKEAWVKGCNRAQRDCHSNLLGDGREIY
ncbi:MAG TPA: DUF1996 domain-containing protein [Albitalea sp.]